MLLVAAFLAAFALQAAGGIDRLSPTSDETSHLPAGYTYVATGDYRLNPQHPPLVKRVAGHAVRSHRPRLDLEHPAWTASPPDEWRFGFDFLYTNDAAGMLRSARLAIVAWTTLLGLYVFLWARGLFGADAGWVAITLFAFSPNLVAHGRLVTMDAPLAVVSTAALFHLWRHAVTTNRWHLAVGWACVGLALATKFSAVVLLPVVAVLVAADAWRRRRPFARTVGEHAVGAVLALVVLWAAYGFPANPGFYLDGLALVNADRVEDYRYYLHGEFDAGGWWYYFLVAFVVKTPVPTLALLGAGIAAARRVRTGAISEAWVLLPAAAYVGVTSALADNLGVRYLLPVYPLVWIAVSRVAPWARSIARPRAAVAALAVLGAVYLFGALRIHPHQLSYFNEVAGGPARGHEWLDDSNLDWGQGLVEIAEYQREHGLGEIRLLYGWNGSPEYWGIRYRPVRDADWIRNPPAPGTYFMGAHLAIRGRSHAITGGHATDWIDRYEPVDRIGHHTFVFRFDP